MTTIQSPASQPDAPPEPHSRWAQLRRSPAVRRAGIGGAMLAAAASLGTLIMATGPDGSAEPQIEKAWPVTVMRANPSELHPMFATYGRVEARTEAKLRTDIQAEVERVFVQEGEWAEEGELLIQMRADEIELRLREANAEAEKEAANLRSTEVEYEMMQQSSKHIENMHRLSQQTLARQQELADRKMIPQALLDSALQQAGRDTLEYQNHKRLLANFPSRVAQNSAALEVALARAARAQLELDKTQLRAPFSGPVLSVAVGPGDRTNNAVVLMTMADASSFEVRAAIPDQYSERIRQALDAGKPISAEVVAGDSANSESPKQLLLSRIAHNVRPGQSGLDAWFRFQQPAPGTTPEGTMANANTNPESLPALGRVLNLTTVLPSEPGLIALPGQAIYNNDRVYLVNNNRLQAATVQRIGEIRLAGGDVQVLVRGDKLNSDSDVMTTALPKAITGLLVEPIRSPIAEDEALVDRVNTVGPQSSIEQDSMTQTIARVTGRSLSRSLSLPQQESPAPAPRA